MSKKRLGLVITDGVGFRNFILTKFVKESNSIFDEVIIYSCLPKSVYKDHLNNHKVVELKTYKENFFTWFFMKLKEVAHLQLNMKNNFGKLDDEMEVSAQTRISMNKFDINVFLIIK